MTAGLMTPAADVRVIPRRKTRRSKGDPPPRPPGAHEAIPKRKPRCDKCHVAEARYEILISLEKLLRLFLCGHHTRQRWAEFIARGYEIREI